MLYWVMSLVGFALGLLRGILRYYKSSLMALDCQVQGY